MELDFFLLEEIHRDHRITRLKHPGTVDYPLAAVALSVVGKGEDT